MKGATVLAVSSRALVYACEAMGMDTGALLAAVGLTRAELTHPDARLPIETMAALWREAYARAGDPDLALHAAEALPTAIARNATSPSASRRFMDPA